MRVGSFLCLLALAVVAGCRSKSETEVVVYTALDAEFSEAILAAYGENQQVDGRADIYALGIILYMMLVRRHPLDIDRNDRWATIREVAVGNVRRPSEVRSDFNIELEQILMQALQEKPEDRYATAGQFGKAIVRFLRNRAAL